MDLCIEAQLLDFLQKNHFQNPQLIKASENILGLVYFAQKENGKITTIKILKTEQLEALYQLQHTDFLTFINLHTKYVNEITQKIAAPKLIYMNDTYVQSHNQLLFYMMHFVPGKEQEATNISIKQKNQIAQVLACIHQSNLTDYNEEFFKLKIHFFARGWQAFIQNQGIDLIEMLALKYLNSTTLKNFLVAISHAVTSAAIINTYCNKAVVLTHSDLKPKNVIWNQEGLFSIIDWENLCMMRAEIDFVDTMTSWVVQKNTDSYVFDHTAAQNFRDNYSLPLTINELDIYLSAAKWMFWIMSCYALENEECIREGLLMLELLDKNSEAIKRLS